MSGDESGIWLDAAIAGVSGDPALENLRAQPVVLSLPERQTAPFIFASPHSGSLYPASFARLSRLHPVTLRKSEDAFVDEPFAAVPELGASMPPTSRGTDIVIGDCYGEAAAAELIIDAQRALTELGFSIVRNAPYAGGYTTNLYGKPESGVHVLHIEVSRAPHLDEGRTAKT